MQFQHSQFPPPFLLIFPHQLSLSLLLTLPAMATAVSESCPGPGVASLLLSQVWLQVWSLWQQSLGTAPGLEILLVIRTPASETRELSRQQQHCGWAWRVFCVLTAPWSDPERFLDASATVTRPRQPPTASKTDGGGNSTPKVFFFKIPDFSANLTHPPGLQKNVF